MHPDRESVGTLLRHVLELLDTAVADSQHHFGLTDYRPRYSPFIKALETHGAMTIRDLADTVGVTHSAASQTVAAMTRHDLVATRPGSDARHRVVTLQPRAVALLPAVHAEWAAVTEAMHDLDAELPVALSTVLIAVTEALDRVPMTERILNAAHRRVVTADEAPVGDNDCHARTC